MKKILAIALLAASLTVSVPAAVLAGLDVGYLTNRTEVYYSARLGYEFKTTASLAHQVEIEIGYTEKSYSTTIIPPPFFSFPTAVFNNTDRIMPLMLNYRGTLVSAKKLRGYFGAGIGVAEIKLSASPASPSSFFSASSFSDRPLAWQGFAGLSYKANDTTLLHLGLKHIWFDDFKIGSTKIPVDSDFIISAGISFRF